MTAITDRDVGHAPLRLRRRRPARRRHRRQRRHHALRATTTRGRLTEIHDPLGGLVTRDYDAAGRLVREVDQLGRATTWTYDAAGRLVEHVDGEGRRREWSYDESGRVRAFGAAGEEPVTITRDALGREVRDRRAGRRARTRFAWDRGGRLVERRRDELALRYGYDDDGRRAFIGYPDGSQTRVPLRRRRPAAALRHPATGRDRVRARRRRADRRRARRGPERALGVRGRRPRRLRVRRRGAPRAGRATRRAASSPRIDGPSSASPTTPPASWSRAGDHTFAYDAGGRLVRERAVGT